jgi:hypothetical protein
LCESFDQLRALHDCTCVRAADAVDPALWNLHWLKVLRLKLGAGLRALPGDELAKLGELQQLILSGNASLASLPGQVTSLKNLRVLELEGCALTCLPEGLSALPGLESINVSNNVLCTLSPALDGCAFLASLNASGNKLTTVDDVPFAQLARLAELKLSRNKLGALPKSIGSLGLLATLELESNLLRQLPNEMCQLKKLKTLKLDGNPIADGKVVRMLARGGKGLKELFKYLGEQADKKGGRKKPAAQAAGGEDDDAEDAEDGGQEGPGLGGVKGGEPESSDLELDDGDL